MHRLVSGLMITVLTLAPIAASAKLQVVTTTTDLGAIAKEIGGEQVHVDTLCLGAQDPHAIEAKPSFMMRAQKSDLVIAVGLGLESGWLPGVIRGARNPKINPGQLGFLEIGPLINPLEVLSGPVTRAQGDIHPDGNPHFTLDPIRTGLAALTIAERMSQLDESNRALYLERAKKFKSRLQEKFKSWSNRLEKIKNRKVVTYHKTLDYFLDRFKFETIMTLEPKPGIPPTASHLLKVTKAIKDNGVKFILIENFYDIKIAERIKEEIPSLHIVSVPVAVGGSDKIKSQDDLYENLVQSFEEK